MRILTEVMQAGPTTGAAIAQFQLARGLARRGHDLSLLYLHDGGYLEQWQAMCTTVTRVSELDVVHLWPDLLRAPRLAAALQAGRATRPELVWDGRYWTLPLSRGIAGRRPVVSVVHGFFEPPTRTDRLLTRLADHYVAISDFVRAELIERGADPQRVHTVYGGLEPHEYSFGGAAQRSAARASLRLGEDDFVVLFYGRVHPVKGIEVLADAVERLAGGNRPARLVVVGGGDDVAYFGSIRSRVRSLGGRVLGPRDDVLTPLHAADVVVVPSQWDEAFGRVVIEGMASGRPVIASVSGGIPEILTGEFARWLFPRGDADALADRLVAVADWQASDPGLGERCAAHVRLNFTMERNLDGLEAVLRLAAG